MKSFKSVPVTLSVIVALLALTITAYGQSPFGGGFDEPEVELVTLSVEQSHSVLAPGSSFVVAVQLNVAEHWHINSAEPYQDYLIPASLQFDLPEAITLERVTYPTSHDISQLGENLSVYDGTPTIYAVFSVADEIVNGYDIPAEFSYQACNDRECRAPQTLEFKVNLEMGETSVVSNPELIDHLATEPATTGTTTPEETSDLQKLIDDYGFWGYFLALGLAFLTGLLLSFSPCTYPMIPITVSIFAGQERSVGRGFFLSLVYVGTMAVMYGIMGLIVSTVGGVFGAWLADPIVVVTIAIVFVIFSLSMFGLYELQVPAGLRNKLGGATSGGGIVGSIILGVVAALVVSPCVGPFVAGILLYIATTGSPLIGFLVLFTFAMGLGTLYILIGTFSSAINKLPKSGMWMEQVKKFFGFVLLLMALYFLQPLISTTLMATLTGLLLLVFSVFGGGFDRLSAESGGFERVKKLLGIVAFLISIYLLGGVVLSGGLIHPPAHEWLPSGGTMSTESHTEIPWITDLESGLTTAKEAGQPAIIDTWATWCVNCRVLEKKTFGDASVQAEMSSWVPVKVQLEKAGTPETKAFMERFGLQHYSLPTVVLVDADGNAAKILQGVVTPDELITEMRAVTTR